MLKLLCLHYFVMNYSTRVVNLTRFSKFCWEHLPLRGDHLLSISPMAIFWPTKKVNKTQIENKNANIYWKCIAPSTSIHTSTTHLLPAQPTTTPLPSIQITNTMYLINLSFLFTHSECVSIFFLFYFAVTQDEINGGCGGVCVSRFPKTHLLQGKVVVLVCVSNLVWEGVRGSEEIR